MKNIQDFLTNKDAPSAGYSFGKLRDNPGDNTGSAVVVALFNDILYSLYSPIKKYLGAVSGTDENETASDFTDVLERISSTVGASAHIASYDYLSGSYILRDGIIWRANADIDTGIDGTTFIAQYNAGKWDSQILTTDREQIYGGVLRINTVDVLHDVDFGATICFDQTSGDIISAGALTKQIDNTFTAGNNQGMLDTGVASADTLYYLYEIKKDSDSSGDYLASLSASTPTMPTGYTMKRIIGTLRTKVSASEIDYVNESPNRISADTMSIGLVRIQDNDILYNAEEISGIYKYLSSGKKAYKLNLATGIRYEAPPGTAGATISSWINIVSGEISGNLIYNTTALPPKISAGKYDVYGREVQYTSDQSLALSDAFGACSQVFADYAYCWMKELIDENGNKKYIPSFDSQPVASLTDIVVSGITVASNVATVATSNTTGLSTGHMVIIKDSDIGYLIGKVTGVVAGVSFTVKTSAGDGSYTGGTYSAKYRIATLHGAGSITGVNVDADIVKYSPSPTKNLIFRGFYRDIDGDLITDSTGVWRDIGGFYLDGSGNVQSDSIISYKSGFNKNDNFFNISCASNLKGVTNTNVPRWNGSLDWRLRGDDYVYTDDTNLGGSLRAVTDNLSLDSFIRMTHSAAGQPLFYAKHGQSITNSGASQSIDLHNDQCGSGTGKIKGSIIYENIPVNEYFWVSVPGWTIATDAAESLSRWIGRFKL